MLVTGPSARGLGNPGYWKRRIAGVAFVAGMTFLLVSSTMSESAHRGRLRTIPVADNVIYMSGGAEWYAAFERGGLWELFRGYLSHPPHSPYSTASAFVGYALLGLKDTSPHYAASVLVFAGMLLCWLGTAGCKRLAPRLAIASAAACIPLWPNAVEYIKPDCCAGILAAGGIACLMLPSRRSIGWRWWTMCGFVFSLALLAKPPVFPQTLFFAFGAAFCRMAYEWLLRRPRRVSFLGPLSFLMATLAPAIPHFVLCGRREFAYVFDILYGAHRADWEFKGTLGQHLLFHSLGPGGSQFLGIPGWVLCGAGGVAVAVVRKSRATKAAIMVWTLVLCITYLPPTVNHFKNPQFAICFQATSIVAAISSLSYLCRRTGLVRARRPSQLWAVRASLSLLCGVCATTFAWTFPRYAPENLAVVDQRTRLVEQLYAEVAARMGSEEGRLLIAGPLNQFNHHLVRLWAVRDGYQWTVTALRKPVDGPEMERRLVGVDVVVANEGGTNMTSDTHGRAEADELLVRQFRSLSEWTKVARFTAPGTSRSFEVFARKVPRAPRARKMPSSSPSDPVDTD